jgi:hypothetical protein
MSTRNVVISDGSAVDQTERDRLPDWADSRGYSDRPAVRRGLDWRPMLALILISGTVALYLAVRFVEWLGRVNDETAWLDVYLVAGLKIGLFVAPLAFLALLGFYLLGAARTRRIVRLPNQMPISVRHIEADAWQPSALASLAAFYSLQAEWARHSDYRSLNQLDLSRAFTGIKPEALDAPAVASLPMLPIAPHEGPIIEQLRAKGHINRSPDGSMLVGFNAEQKPLYLRWGKAGLSAVAGGSGSGKTSTMRLIAAQHAMNGGALVLCDGHGEAGDQSLIQSCAPLAEAYMFEPAIDDDRILQTIAAVDRIGRERLTGRIPPAQHEPILLIVDEFTSLVRNHRHASAIVNMLVNAGDEWRKVHMMAVVIGHHWRGDLIDGKLGSALRSAIGARIVHRTAPTEARFLLKAEEAQAIDRLPDGEVLFFDGSSAAARLTVPYLDSAALQSAIRYIPEHPDWPLACSALPENLFSAPAAHYDTEQSRAEQRDALARALFRKGHTFRTVGDTVRRFGFAIDNDRLTELRHEVLNGRHAASQ